MSPGGHLFRVETINLAGVRDTDPCEHEGAVLARHVTAQVAEDIRTMAQGE